jgi:hypothetical protein
VSQDGRSLLYFHDPTVWLGDPHRSEWEPARPYGAQLHLYREGIGDSVIVSDVDHWVEGRRPLDSPLPPEAVVYDMPNKHGHNSMRGIWTRGDRVVRSIGDFVPR